MNASPSWRSTTVRDPRTTATLEVLAEVAQERRRQLAKHGDQSDLPDGTGPDAELLADVANLWDLDGADRLTFGYLATLQRQQTDARSRSAGDGTVTFADVLLEETLEALAEDDDAKLEAELLQVSATAAAWVEAIRARRAVSL